MITNCTIKNKDIMTRKWLHNGCHVLIMKKFGCIKKFLALQNKDNWLEDSMGFMHDEEYQEQYGCR
jgi:hypothetical protein